MYPDLSYLFYDLFGTQPDNWLSVFKTFGVFLILSFIVSAYFLRQELKRKEEEGLLHGSVEKNKIGFPATWQEIAQNAFFGFIIGFKLPYILQHFEEFKPDPASIILSAKGTLLWGLLGAAVFGYLRYMENRKRQLAKPIIKEVSVMPHQRVGDITILAAISGLIGARLFSIIESEENIKAFIQDPLEQLLSGSGLAMYGGLIVAFLAVVLYGRKKGIPPLHLMDAAAPALIMGYAIGRIGCQLSGDGDWGIVNTAPPPSWWFFPNWAWAYDYPHNVLNDGVPIEGCTFHYCSHLAENVFPTPIYETFFSLIIFAILWALRRRLPFAGMMFFLYLFLNGIERFWVEGIRTNPDISLFGFEATQAEYIAVLLMVIGLVGFVISYLRGKKRLATVA